MECDVYRDGMLDLLYGEASENTRRAVEAHQTACHACRLEFAAFRAMRQDLVSWKEPVERRLRRAVGWQPWALAASLLLALAGTGGSLALARGQRELRAQMQEQDRRHREEVGRPQASVAPADLPGLRSVVQEMIEQSERRQGQRMEASLLALSQRTEAQRRYDMAQLSAGLSYLEGKAGLHAARTTELMGEVLLASQQR